jgi:hypothetical protein
MVQGLVQLQSTFIQIDSMRDVAPVEIEDRAERFTELLISGLIAPKLGVDP